MPPAPVSSRQIPKVPTPLPGSRGAYSGLDGRRTTGGNQSPGSRLTGEVVGTAPDRLSLRELRHHTKNALQGLIAQIDSVSELQENEAGRRLVKELQRRILLSAAVSDSLFGFTGAPQPLEERLRSLCGNVASLFSVTSQKLRVEVRVEGTCPSELHDVLLRSAHEMVGNAVKHGLYALEVGLIRVDLVSGPSLTVLTVQDNGWALDLPDEDADALEMVHDLVSRQGGTLRLQRDAAATTATISLPYVRSNALFR